MAGIPWDKHGQCCLAPSGDFAGIPWGKQGQCYLTPSGRFAVIPWGKQGQCCLIPSGRFCRYSLGYKRSVLSNAKCDILQVFLGVNKVSVI